jgi:hypothetical protein
LPVAGERTGRIGHHRRDSPCRFAVTHRPLASVARPARECEPGICQGPFSSVGTGSPMTCATA